jgi:hypothetical protein
MYEVLTTLAPDEAFQELKKALLKEKAKIIEEESPRKLVVEHGSWFEYSPKTLEKIIRFNLIAEDSKTRIVSNTQWKTSSMTLAVLGFIGVSIVGAFLLWLAWDIKAYVEGLRSTFAGWLAEQLGYMEFVNLIRIAQTFEIFAFIIFAILIIALIHTIYLYSKREEFTKEILALLPRSK